MLWATIKKKWQDDTLSTWLILPYCWYIIFLLLPCFFLFKISFSPLSNGPLPYQSMMHHNGSGHFSIIVSLASYINILKDPFYRHAFKNSLVIASLSTFFCLMIGFPMAYVISQSRRAITLLALSIIPFFASFLIRIYAWIHLIGTKGVVNQVLQFFGMKTIALMHTKYAVIIGMVYSYLPFMIFPIYSALLRIDPAMIESAQDLGCLPLSALWRILIPLSMPGILSGIIFVFIPTMSEYLIPEILGGDQSIVLGRILWSEFFIVRDWPLAASMSIVMMILAYVPIFLFNKIKRHLQNRMT
jgi:putrescine transport system permease protein